MFVIFGSVVDVTVAAFVSGGARLFLGVFLCGGFAIFIIITMVLIISSIVVVIVVVQVVNLTRKVVVPIRWHVTHRFIVVVVVLGYGNVSG